MAKQQRISFTGERMTEDRSHGDMFLSSLARYEFAAKYLSKNDVVLDIACGTGYGTNFLASFCKKVIGADIDEQTVNYCKEKYGNNADFVLVDRNYTQIQKRKFDTVVSMETIEHIKEYKKFLKTLKGIVRPGGKIILSTPNNFLGIYPPENEFHVYEFRVQELVSVAQKIFKEGKIEVFGQQPVGRMSSEKIQDTVMKRIYRKVKNSIFRLDNKLFHIIARLDHLAIYKKMTDGWRGYKADNEIYEIDLTREYKVPGDFLLVINI